MKLVNLPSGDVFVDFEGIPEAVLHDGQVYVLMDAVASAPRYRAVMFARTREKTADELKTELLTKLADVRGNLKRVEAEDVAVKARLLEIGFDPDAVKDQARTPAEDDTVIVPTLPDTEPAKPMTSTSGVGFLKIG